jgi:DNA-binding CsgD family transcriptional regulator
MTPLPPLTLANVLTDFTPPRARYAARHAWPLTWPWIISTSREPTLWPTVGWGAAAACWMGWNRLALAQSLLALAQPEVARPQAEKAIALFTQLEARAHQTRATDFLRRLDAPATSAPSDPANLTPREREVLGLLATGLSNSEISRELVLSVRTVDRHISNIYSKLDVSGPSARAAATTYAHRHAIVQF